LQTYKLSDLSKITEKAVIKEYSVLGLLYDTNEVKQQMVVNDVYGKRNRYSDIITYDKTRVKLVNGVTKVPEEYINACYINSPFSGAVGDRKIIASQGPLPQTTDHFWQMIIENNVTLIVSTCKLVEDKREKCNRFWPAKTQQEYCINPSNPAEKVTVNLVKEVHES
jgi:protein tyrosine phosphatase